jgi:hypothetical protein
LQPAATGLAAAQGASSQMLLPWLSTSPGPLAALSVTSSTKLLRQEMGSAGMLVGGSKLV